MKKLSKLIVISLLTGFLLSSSHVYGQFRDLKLGLKLAPNFGWLKPRVDEFKSGGTLMGVSWGFVAEKYFEHNYAMVSGLSINFVNGRMTVPGMEGDIDRKYYLKYAEVPLLVKMRTNEIMEGINFFGNIGFAPGIRIGAKAMDVSGGTSTDKYTFTDETSFFRLALIVGAGAEYAIDESTTVFAGLNFNNGFVNALKGKNEKLNVSNKANANFIEINVGVLF